MSDVIKSERVIIFIDGSYLYHILKVLIKNKKPNELNFEGFIRFLAGNNELIKTYYVGEHRENLGFQAEVALKTSLTRKKREVKNNHGL